MISLSGVACSTQYAAHRVVGLHSKQTPKACLRGVKCTVSTKGHSCLVPVPASHTPTTQKRPATTTTDANCWKSRTFLDATPARCPARTYWGGSAHGAKLNATPFREANIFPKHQGWLKSIHPGGCIRLVHACTHAPEPRCQDEEAWRAGWDETHRVGVKSHGV